MSLIHQDHIAGETPAERSQTMATGGPRNNGVEEAPATIPRGLGLRKAEPDFGIDRDAAIAARIAAQNVHAWFVIESADADERFIGTQRMVSSFDLRGLVGQANFILGQIGAQPTVHAEADLNTTGHVWRRNLELEQDKRSGLKWSLYPCTVEGINLSREMAP